MAEARDIADALEGLQRESLRLEEDCTYSCRSHFEAERFWSHINHGIGVPAALAAGVASVSAFNDRSVLAGALAVVTGALAALATFLNPAALAAAHHAAGTRYLTLRNRNRFLREARLDPNDLRAFRSDLAQLVERRNELNESSPPIPRLAFKTARKLIGRGEAKYEVD